MELGSSLPTPAYPVMASLSQVMHEEPEHVAIKQVSVVQTIFIPLSLILLNHLEPRRVGDMRSTS